MPTRYKNGYSIMAISQLLHLIQLLQTHHELLPLLVIRITISFLDTAVSYRYAVFAQQHAVH